MSVTTCRTCGESKATSSYYIANRNTGARVLDCRRCHAAKSVARRKARYTDEELKVAQREYNARRDPRTRLSAHLSSRYGLTLDQWEELRESQDHRCAICGIHVDDIAPEPSGRNVLHVDHCHDSHRVRGLLCGSCNRGLGSFGDDPEVMRRAIAYVEKRGVPMARAHVWVAKRFTSRSRRRADLAARAEDWQAVEA